MVMVKFDINLLIIFMCYGMCLELEYWCDLFIFVLVEVMFVYYVGLLVLVLEYFL